jgi:hypothetical protein
MNAWLVQMRQAADWVIGFGAPPGGGGERILVVGVGLILGYVVMRLCVRGAEMPDLGWPRSVGALLLVALCALAGEAAGMIYLAPRVPAGAALLAVRIGAPVVAVLVVAIPLCYAMLKGSYGKVLVAVLFGAGAWVLGMLVVHLLLRSIRAESKDMNLIRDRTEFMNKELNRK